jgi:methionyl-tRNA formyltransferase
MYTKRIIFLGTRGQEITSRHLEAFVNLGANILACVEAPQGSISTTHTEEDPYEGINEVARRLNIPLLCPRNPKDEGFIDRVRSLDPDVFIVAGYQFYMTHDLIELPPLGSINFHTSCLPRHAGMHPGFWAVWYGDRESGVVIHYMDGGIDTGDIIFETKVPVLPGDTIDKLYDRCWKKSVPLVKKLLDGLEKNSLPRKPQDMSLYMYNYEIIEKDFELDFRQPAEVLSGRVSMAPGKFYFILNGEKYYVRECSVIEEPVLTRKFETGVPVRMGGGTVFVTPRKFFRIDKIVKNEREIDPASLIG